MALGILKESFVQRYAHQSERPNRVRRCHLYPLDPRRISFLLLFLILLGGLPTLTLAQQDVSQPMQELQDQWREIMKKEYNPSANQVMQPAARSTPAPTFEMSEEKAESVRTGSVNASGQTSQSTQKVREKSSSRTKQRSGSVRRSKFKSKRSSERVSRSAAKTRVKGKTSSSQLSTKAGRSGTAAKAQSNKTSAPIKTQATPAKSVQVGRPATGNKAVSSQTEKNRAGKAAVSTQQKGAPAKSNESSQKKKAAAKTVASGQSVKKSGR